MQTKKQKNIFKKLTTSLLVMGATFFGVQNSKSTNSQKSEEGMSSNAHAYEQDSFLSACVKEGYFVAHTSSAYSENFSQESILTTPIGQNQEQQSSAQNTREEKYAAFLSVDGLLQIYTEEGRTSLNEDELRMIRGFFSTMLGLRGAISMQEDVEQALEKGTDPTQTRKYKQMEFIQGQIFKHIPRERKEKIQQEVARFLQNQPHASEGHISLGKNNFYRESFLYERMEK